MARSRKVFQYRQATPGGGWVGFAFGGFFGGLFGIGWGVPGATQPLSWVAVVGFALVVGLLGAQYGDRFWERVCYFVPWVR